jgi:hypothetical protein
VSSGVTVHERAGAACALGAANGSLCLAWTGTDTRLNLLWSADGRTFTAKETLHHRSSHTQSNGQSTSVTPLPPALATIPTGLAMAWTGTDRRLNVMGLPGSHLQHVLLDERSNLGPALAASDTEVALVWVGSDRRLNLVRGGMNGSFGPPFTFEQKTSFSPAACYAGPNLVLAWTGTDRRPNLALVQPGVPVQPLILPEPSSRETRLLSLGNEIVLGWRNGDRPALRAFDHNLQPGRSLGLPGWTRHGPGLALHNHWLMTATVHHGRRIGINQLSF